MEYKVALAGPHAKTREKLIKWLSFQPLPHFFSRNMRLVIYIYFK